MHHASNTPARFKHEIYNDLSFELNNFPFILGKNPGNYIK